MAEQCCGIPMKKHSCDILRQAQYFDIPMEEQCCSIFMEKLSVLFLNSY